MQSYDVVIIGAGAAGMMCAIEAGKRGRSVLVLDHAASAGREDPHLRRRALQLHQHPRQRPRTSCRRIRTSASRRSAATRRTTSSPWSNATASPSTRRRWASCSATAPRAQIIDMLLAEMRRRRRGARGWRPTSKASTKTEDGFALALSIGRLSPASPWWSPRGGKSIPKMGATGFGYDARRAVRPRGRRDAARRWCR